MKLRHFSAATILLFSFITLFSFTTDPTENLVNDVLEQTNKFRQAQGLQKLQMLDELNAIAKKHSEDMANGSVAFGHDGFESRQELAKQKVKGIRTFAENVAVGPKTAKEVVLMWENSVGHRRNLAGPFKYIGIGIAADRYGRLYYTQVFAD